MWRAQATRTKDAMLKDRAMYQLGIGHLLLGEDKQGIKMLRGLIARADQTPYGALALASMGDYFWRNQSHQAAQTLYLRAASTSLQSIHPYAQYMQGWASAEQGSAGLALQAMSLAYSKIMQAPEQLQYTMLSPYVLEGLAPVYAASAKAEKATEFIAQFKLSPKKQRAWLTRVASAYATQGQHAHAMQVYQRLAYQATPRQQAFYAYQWIESRRVAAPRVDETWSQVMINWVGFISLLATTSNAAQTSAPEVKIYRQAVVEEQRRCIEQAKLRPTLSAFCRPALKAFLTELKREVDSEEVLFEYATLSANEGDLEQARWAWRELLKLKDSVYRGEAVKRLKKSKN